MRKGPKRWETGCKGQKNGKIISRIRNVRIEIKPPDTFWMTTSWPSVPQSHLSFMPSFVYLFLFLMMLPTFGLGDARKRILTNQRALWCSICWWLAKDGPLTTSCPLMNPVENFFGKRFENCQIFFEIFRFSKFFHETVELDRAWDSRIFFDISFSLEVATLWSLFFFFPTKLLAKILIWKSAGQKKFKFPPHPCTPASDAKIFVATERIM